MSMHEYYFKLMDKAIAGERGDEKCIMFLKHGNDYVIPWELNGKQIKLRKLYRDMLAGRYPYPNLSDYDKVSVQVFFKSGGVREYVIYKERTDGEIVYLQPDSVLLWFGIIFNSRLCTEAYLDILNMFRKAPMDIPEGAYIKATSKIPSSFPVYFAWERILELCGGLVQDYGIPEGLFDTYAGWTGTDFVAAEEAWELKFSGLWERTNPPGQLCQYYTAEAMIRAYLPIKELRNKIAVSVKDY